MAQLRRPAVKIRARMITEAELRFVDAPLLLVEDVDWLTVEEFDHLHRGGGLAKLLAGIDPQLTRLGEAEMLAAKLSLVQRALAEDLRRGDRRTAAFRAAELARFDADAAGELIARLSREIVAGDDHKGIGWGLAYALHRLREWPGRAELIERLRRLREPFAEALFKDLRELEEM